MKKIKCIFVAMTLSISVESFADYLVQGATVKEVSNTAGNNELFYIHVEGGVGLCANSQIRFPMSAAGSEKIFDRGFSIALAAYVSGSKINVYDYSEGSESCNGAESIRMVK